MRVGMSGFILSLKVLLNIWHHLKVQHHTTVVLSNACIIHVTLYMSSVEYCAGCAVLC
jgi:hypothetical protein